MTAIPTMGRVIFKKVSIFSPVNSCQKVHFKNPGSKLAAWNQMPVNERGAILMSFLMSFLKGICGVSIL
jgi:hypothetical protein